MNKNKTIIYTMLILFLIIFSACSSNEETVAESQSKSNLGPLYEGTIEFVFNENLLFSKYDVNVVIDEKHVANIDHGASKKISIELPRGKHEIRFEKEDDKGVDETLDFEVKGDFHLKYEIYSKSNKIKVNEIDLASETKETYQEDETFQEETSQEETTIETIETKGETSVKAYPKDNAKKAIITSITNSLATDIFLEDRETIDTSKFHSYSDTNTEFAVKITDEGNWTAISEDTWRVEDMYLLNPKLNLAVKLNADISYDGENYTLSNGKKVSANPSKIDGDEGFLNVEEVSQSESSPYYVIPETLIEGKRAEDPQE